MISVPQKNIIYAHQANHWEQGVVAAGEDAFLDVEDGAAGVAYIPRGGMIRAKANIAKVECRASLLDMPRCSNVTKGNIALTNLVYNMCRLVQIRKYQANIIAIQ